MKLPYQRKFTVWHCVFLERRENRYKSGDEFDREIGFWVLVRFGSARFKTYETVRAIEL